jgi:hypothetical protein
LKWLTETIQGLDFSTPEGVARGYIFLMEAAARGQIRKADVADVWLPILRDARANIKGPMGKRAANSEKPDSNRQIDNPQPPPPPGVDEAGPFGVFQGRAPGAISEEEMDAADAALAKEAQAPPAQVEGEVIHENEEEYGAWAGLSGFDE